MPGGFISKGRSGGVCPLVSLSRELDLSAMALMHDSHPSPCGDLCTETGRLSLSDVSTSLIFFFTAVFPFSDNEKPDSHYLKMFPSLLIIPGGTPHPATDSHHPLLGQAALPQGFLNCSGKEGMGISQEGRRGKGRAVHKRKRKCLCPFDYVK